MRFIFLILLCLAAVGASAQSAADVYHDAAGLYINGEMEAAEQAAVTGLAIDPDDAKLQALLEHIRQQQEQQNQQQSEDGDEGEQNEEPQDQQNEQENDGEPERQDSEERNDGQGEQNEPQPDGSTESDRQEEQQPEPEQQADQRNQNGHEDERQEPNLPQSSDGDATPEDVQLVQPGQMSRAEAERILGALRADESVLLRSIQRRPANPRHVERDW